MKTTHDPNKPPKPGEGIFRWMLEQRKLEESQPREWTEEQKAAIAELRKRNAERGTAIVRI